MAASPVTRIEQRPPALEDEVVAWFDVLRDPLLRYLLTLGLPLADGEEVVQDAFVALFQHLRRSGDRTNLRAWVFRVAHNLGLKKRGRNSCTCQIDWESLADPAPDPEEQFLKREMGRQVRAVVGALSEQDRRCLVLRLEGLRCREIATTLAMSLGAVSMSIARSLARIARATGR